MRTRRTSRSRSRGWRRRRRRSPGGFPRACGGRLSSAFSKQISKLGGRPMPEPVIVATARSPIGRAFKGSLVDLRPDDLAATIVQAALAKVPELDPAEIDDLMLGCGLPGGESGFNQGRIVSVLAGLSDVPGCTITR